MEKTLEWGGVLLADAPTGTGKSAAYLAPAILDVASNGGRVVVSTATLALQAQLLSEDWVCPVCADCLPLSHGTSSQSNLFVV
ncbi:MAG: hypothetical protein H0X19_14660 [Rubrobacter sp.]|nr:hypothetical protein [Rubrobacter sp.]